MKTILLVLLMALPILTESGAVRAGTTTLFGSVGGTIKVNHQSATIIGGAGEQDLHTYSLPANALKNNGDRLVWKFGVRFAQNTNAKTLKVYWGSANVIATFNSSDANGEEFWFELEIVKNGSNNQLIARKEFTQANSSAFPSGVVLLTAQTQTDTSAITMKCTGNSSGTSDIVQYLTIIEWHPAPPQ